MTGIVPGHIITVETEKGMFRTTKLIVTAGAWANKVLKTTGLHLPLKVAADYSVSDCQYCHKFCGYNVRGSYFVWRNTV